MSAARQRDLSNEAWRHLKLINCKSCSDEGIAVVYYIALEWVNFKQ
jgi:hypothetical protein